MRSCAKARLFFSAGSNSLETEDRYVLGFRFVFRVRIACTRTWASLFKTTRRICKSDCAAFERVFIIIPELGFSLAKRENPASPAEAQEGRHQWFPPSDFLPFPKIIWCKPETCARCEKENGRGFFLSCRSLTIRNVRYLAATQAVSSPQARHKVNCPKGKRGSPGG